MVVRLHKHMALCGIDSRRRCEDLIVQGRVSVNGVVATKLGTCIDPDKDRIFVDGKEIFPAPGFIYYALNKPAGFVVTMKDSHGAATVMDIMKDIKERIFPVGRLDRDTRGLLLFTNDGQLANRLMHPRYHLEKEYLATIKRELERHNLRWLKKGIVLEGKKTLAATVDIYRKMRHSVVYRLVIREGRKRQIRRMFKAVGHPVTDLKRVGIGPIRLGRLAQGEYRLLTLREIRALKKAVNPHK